jgi:hypothetical protein
VSTWQRKVEPGSSDSNSKCALWSRVRAGGWSVIVVSGGVVSTVHV